MMVQVELSDGLMPKIIYGKYWNSFAVLLPCGEVIPCHNLASAQAICMSECSHQN
jgi:hypothetical protein